MRPARIEPLRGGASLMVAWRLAGRHVLVVGGGREAARRVFSALDADARVTLVAPVLGAVLAHRARRNQVTWRSRCFELADLEGIDMVLCAVDVAEVSESVFRACRARRIPVNCADRPEECDFWFPAVHRDGPVQIAVSTNGRGPGLAARIRDRLATELPVGLGDAVASFGEVRATVRSRMPVAAERMPTLAALARLWPVSAEESPPPAVRVRSS